MWTVERAGKAVETWTANAQGTKGTRQWTRTGQHQHQHQQMCIRWHWPAHAIGTLAQRVAPMQNRTGHLATSQSSQSTGMLP